MIAFYNIMDNNSNAFLGKKFREENPHSGHHLPQLRAMNESPPILLKTMQTPTMGMNHSVQDRL